MICHSGGNYSLRNGCSFTKEEFKECLPSVNRGFEGLQNEPVLTGDHRPPNPLVLQNILLYLPFQRGERQRLTEAVAHFS